MTRAGTNCYGLSLSKLILKMLAFSRRGRLLSPSSQARRGVVVRRRRAKLRPVHALSLTSWFRVPSQMERSELLSRASCCSPEEPPKMTALGSLHEYGLRQLSLDALELSATEFVLLARAGHTK